MKPYIDHFHSPIGKLFLLFENDELIRLNYSLRTPHKQSSSAASRQVIQQLENYFEDSTFVFNIPFTTHGTPYQKKVWQALQQIPAGKVKTYSDLADEIKSGPRAVGNACRENPLPIIIPCHRIIAQNSIGGYAGKTDGNNIDIKQWLLKHELD